LDTKVVSHSPHLLQWSFAGKREGQPEGSIGVDADVDAERATAIGGNSRARNLKIEAGFTRVRVILQLDGILT
jgi:hypothetical protein